MAHLISYSIESGRKFINLGLSEYAPLFPATSNDLLCRYPVVKRSFLPRTHFFRESVRRYSEMIYYILLRLQNVLPGLKLVFTIQSGYETTLNKSINEQNRLIALLESGEFSEEMERYSIIISRGPLVRTVSLLSKHAESVREYFKPTEQCLLKVNELLGKYRDDKRIIIGVHIRRKDYRRFEGGRYFYPLSTYHDVMKMAETLFDTDRPVFFVCSDESISADDFPGTETVIGTGMLMEDMYSLSACDYLIGPPSTFSGWASFYGKVPRYTIKDPVKDFSLWDFHVKHI